MDDWLADFAKKEHLPPAFGETVTRIGMPLTERIVEISKGRTSLCVGICGTQASGKSTLTAVVRRMLESHGLRVAAFSIDDLYRTRAEREALARQVHPLFAVRGVPGTHDVALGLRVLDSLSRPGDVILPSFDKAADDRRDGSTGPVVHAPVDVILFEGWCVGARPETPTALATPVNDLERYEDPDGRWRTHVNNELAGPYAELFGRIDLLAMLRAPCFEVVLSWRQEQERKLRERLAREGGSMSRAMTDEEVARFISHYERLTRYILQEMPPRADAVFAIDAQRRPMG